MSAVTCELCPRGCAAVLCGKARPFRGWESEIVSFFLPPLLAEGRRRLILVQYMIPTTVLPYD